MPPTGLNRSPRHDGRTRIRSPATDVAKSLRRLPLSSFPAKQMLQTDLRPGFELIDLGQQLFRRGKLCL